VAKSAPSSEPLSPAAPPRSASASTRSRPAARRTKPAFARAFRFVAELIVGVGVGGFIGWVLDRLLGTKPWLLVLFVALGFAAGLLNVIRAAQKAQAEVAASQLATPSVNDEDDDDR
jgi:ATP synthase protein I